MVDKRQSMCVRWADTHLNGELAVNELGIAHQLNVVMGQACQGRKNCGNCLIRLTTAYASQVDDDNDKVRRPNIACALVDDCNSVVQGTADAVPNAMQQLCNWSPKSTVQSKPHQLPALELEDLGPQATTRRLQAIPAIHGLEHDGMTLQKQVHLLGVQALGTEGVTVKNSQDGVVGVVGEDTCHWESGILIGISHTSTEAAVVKYKYNACLRKYKHHAPRESTTQLHVRDDVLLKQHPNSVCYIVRGLALTVLGQSCRRQGMEWVTCIYTCTCTSGQRLTCSKYEQPHNHAAPSYCPPARTIDSRNS